MTKGFKVFNKDWTCNGFQYEVGGTYEMKESPICCNRGFHFCTKLSDCFNYYAFNSDNKVAEVEAIGEVVSDFGDTKHCTNKIKIVRELTWHEVLDLVNMGKDCTGYCNSGNRNSGDCNSGNWNSGNRNSGDCNSGNWNSGNWNSGNWNSGNRNSGNRNSGDWNDTSFSNGVFNTKEPNIYMFDELTEMTYRDWLNHPARFILNGVPFDELRWVYSENMTDDEKKEHPEHDVTGGFLKEFNYSKNRQNWWDELDSDDKKTIKSLPNFDKEKFERVVGIKID
nr:MAG TPA: pentapeptide repeat protein [Caudoviricetes sp.]